MIVDSLRNCSSYESLHKDFAVVFDILKKIANDEITEKIVLVEDCIWVNAPSQMEETAQPKVFEAHKKFIDIHYIVSGAETFGYSNIDRLKSVKEYDEANDYELLDGNKDFVTLKSGDFCIVFPRI